MKCYIYPFGEIRGIRVRKTNENKADKCFSFVRFKGYETKHSKYIAET